MSNLIQMVYISKANIPVSAQGGEIGPEVAKILRKSRTNNRARNIVGALYFGNGYFYQCLEGDEQSVMKLYAILQQDKRHRDLRIISKRPVEKRSFGDWEMKFLPAEKEIGSLLRSFGMSAFDPYRFNEEMSEKMLRVLLQGRDMALDSASGQQQSPQCACTAWKFATLALGGMLCADLIWRMLA